MQQSEFEYHFSGRLVPWVHYVPLSYNTADVVAKVRVALRVCTTANTTVW